MQAGGIARVYPGGAGGGGFGPIVGLSGHVALLPLIRVGAYVAHDATPAGLDGEHAPWRQTTSAGLRIKVGSPWPRGAWHAWAFLGAGYARVYGPSYHRELDITDGSGNASRADALVGGAGGGHVEIPLGLGVGYRFWKPWELTLEVGSRFGFGFNGSLYRDAGRAASVRGGDGRGHVGPVGNDTVSPFAVLGVSLDE